jgi:spermidine/putrescine transport system substrate-binding protein
MNRRLFLMSLPGLLGCTSARERRLNVFNWSDYVAPETIPNFEKEFGVTVNYQTYESNEEMLAKVMAGNSGWDVVFPTNYMVVPMVESNLLARLDHTKLTELDRLSEDFRRPSWDPELGWGVPYMWGGTGIVYNPSVTPAPAAWADLWSDRYGGRLTMLDDPAEVIGACLLKLGFSLNSTDPAELEKAKQEAIAQKKFLRAYLNAEVQDQLVSGDVLTAQLWATTSVLAQQAKPELQFLYPPEGFALYCDSASILRESKEQELAHEFLNYLLRPEVSAQIATVTQTATANGAGLVLMPDNLRNNTTLFPPSETIRRGEWFVSLPADAHEARDRVWTEIKSA